MQKKIIGAIVVFIVLVIASGGAFLALALPAGIALFTSKNKETGRPVYLDLVEKLGGRAAEASTQERDYTTAASQRCAPPPRREEEYDYPERNYLNPMNRDKPPAAKRREHNSAQTALDEERAVEQAGRTPKERRAKQPHSYSQKFDGQIQDPWDLPSEKPPWER